MEELQLIKNALDESNKKGVFGLDHSHAIYVTITNLAKKIKEQENTIRDLRSSKPSEAESLVKAKKK